MMSPLQTTFRPFPSLPVRTLALVARRLLGKLREALNGVFGPLPEPLEEAFKDAAISLSNLVNVLSLAAPEEPQFSTLRDRNGADKSRLTSRERQVLRLLCAGYRNHDIAKRLDYGLGTIKADVRAILEKLGVSDRTQAAAMAIRRGLI
ncbi:MAG: response regulator transcription factor [Candidatus Eremiobacteraeota bacterium]|nr:response regulator transcription factor [Candidatus Eremiobacteraeota bacterium]